MNKLTIDTNGRDALYMQLSGYTLSLNRRGVNVVPVAYSEHYATIEIQVTGKRGIVRKFMIVAYDESTYEWLILTDKHEFRSIDLTNVGTICRSMVQGISSLVSKI